MFNFLFQKETQKYIQSQQFKEKPPKNAPKLYFVLTVQL